MKALVLKGNSALEFTDVPLPEKVTQDDVLVRIRAAGLCSSDIERAFAGKAYHYPLIMGHELSGVVEEAAERSAFKQGDRVVIYPLLPCGRCLSCQSGEYAQCTDYDYFGSRRDGGFARYLYVPEANLLPVPQHVDLLHAAMAEPCAVALHGVNKLSVKPGDTAAVFGSGPIGNMIAQWLRIRGCPRVIVSDIDDTKLDIAAEMGFITVNPRETDPVEFMLCETGGVGVDAAVEACGLPLTFIQALRAAAPFGEVVFLGNIKGEARIEEKVFSGILRKELVIYGSWNSKITPAARNDWTTVLEYMDKGIDAASLISHTPSLSKGPEILRKFAEKDEFFNKVIFSIT